MSQGWLQTVTAKQLYFHAVAQHRLGKVAQSEKNFGIAVARMQKAVSLLQEAEKRGEGAFKGYVSVCVCVCVWPTYVVCCTMYVEPPLPLTGVDLCLEERTMKQSTRIITLSTMT